MAELKTRATRLSVKAFIAKIADEERRKDCEGLVKLMKAATGRPPVMWGLRATGHRVPAPRSYSAYVEVPA